MSPPQKKILFLTHSEYGQTQVLFAIISELLKNPDISIHMSSFQALGPRIKQFEKNLSALNTHATSPSPGHSDPITFHPIPGKAMVELMIEQGNSNTHPGGFWGCWDAYAVNADVLAPWGGDGHIERMEALESVIREVKPDLIVIDVLFHVAYDAARRAAPAVKKVVVNPMSMATFYLGQPRGEGFWKYPIMASSWPFPLPWYLIPLNIILFLRLVISSLLHPKMRAIEARRAAAGIKTIYPVSEGLQDDMEYIVADAPKANYPCHVPANVTLTGPLLVPALPVKEVDKELATWLDQPNRRTVLINQGSHALTASRGETELARGIRTALQQLPDVQVLWKLKMHEFAHRSAVANGGAASGPAPEQGKDTARSILSKEIEQGRVRIVEWLTPDPAAILETGKVKCMMHHGGANSLYEAMAYGVPHIILPAWFDTYDNVPRVEWLGVGVNGCPSTAPNPNADEFGAALLKVLGSEEGQAMEIKAKTLAEQVLKCGGRVRGAERLLEILETTGADGVNGKKRL